MIRELRLQSAYRGRVGTFDIDSMDAGRNSV